VLPNPDGQPTGVGESEVGVGVAIAVADQLVGPKRVVPDRSRSMVRARVPKAAVDEHSDSRAWKEEVSLSA
jgi:hypothetical protein